MSYVSEGKLDLKYAWPFVCDKVKQGMLDCDATQIKHAKTHKRMLHVNSIWNMDVELSVSNVELKKLNVGFCNMNVE